MAIFYIFMVFCFFGGEFHSVESACKKFETLKDFDATTLQGRWYQMKLYSSDNGTEAYPCSTIDYTVHQDGQYTHLHTNELKQSPYIPSTNLTRTSHGMAWHPNEPALFDAFPQNGVTPSYEGILGINDVGFALIYRCTETLGKEHYSVVGLTKNLNLYQETSTWINDIAENNLPKFPNMYKLADESQCRDVYPWLFSTIRIVNVDSR